MTLQQIIEDMERQIGSFKEFGITVSLSMEDAQAIVKALKSIPAEFSPTATPTYEWTLDDSELPVNKGDVIATQQYLDDRLAEMENRLIFLINTGLTLKES